MVRCTNSYGEEVSHDPYKKQTDLPQINIRNIIRQSETAANKAVKSSDLKQRNKQDQDALIANIFLINCGHKFKKGGTVNLEALGHKLKLEADRKGNLKVNGRKLHLKKIGDGIRLFALTHKK